MEDHQMTFDDWLQPDPLNPGRFIQPEGNNWEYVPLSDEEIQRRVARMKVLEDKLEKLRRKYPVIHGDRDYRYHNKARVIEDELRMLHRRPQRYRQWYIDHIFAAYRRLGEEEKAARKDDNS